MAASTVTALLVFVIGTAAAGEWAWAGMLEFTGVQTTTWLSQAVDDGVCTYPASCYHASTMKIVIIRVDTPTSTALSTLAARAESLLGPGTCHVMVAGSSLTDIGAINDYGTCFDLQMGQGEESTWTIDMGAATHARGMSPS